LYFEKKNLEDWKLGHVQDCMPQGFLLAAVDSDRVKE
jgi:hypothetical protein